jgi:hypothetical protein
MEAYAAEGAASVVRLGEDAEAPRLYYCVDAMRSDARVIACIISSGHGIDPVVALSADLFNVIIGHDCNISVIHVPTGDLASTTRVLGVVYDVLPLDDARSMIVVHEIGVLRLTLGGRILWSTATDVIEECRLLKGGGCLYVRTNAKCGAAYLDVETGQRRKAPCS